MYTAFYGLREKPFSLSPNPRFLFLAESHREALAHLLYGIDEGEGFIAITGEVGTGKTTLCRTLLERLVSDTEVAFLFNPSGSPSELLRSIAKEFGLHVDGLSRVELGESLNEFLLEKKQEGRRVLLIIDEAQNLSAGTLEQIRLLSNLETASSKLIQILLLGQPELDRKLESRDLRQLRQRIGVRWRLDPLSLRETGEYIRYRLRIAAGVERGIFTPAALREVHRQSGGVPRLVNIVCDRSLLAGYASGKSEIGPRIVRACAREIPAAGRRARNRPGKRGSWASLGVAFASFAATAALAAVLVRIGLTAGTASFGRWVEPARPAGSLVEVSAPPPLESIGSPLLGDWPESTPTDAVLIEVDTDEGVISGIHPLAEFVPESFVAARDVAEPRALLASIEPTVSVVQSDPGPGSLGAILEQRDRAEGRYEACNSILESYGLAPLERVPRSRAEALTWLEDRGLAVLSIEEADVGLLRRLNHPVLLDLQSDRGEERLVALRRLGVGLASLYGASDRGALEVPIDEIEGQWEGRRAFVVWRSFEKLPGWLRLGQSGVGVTWLQNALRELGHFGGEASGLFDYATRDGIRELQSSLSLLPDGVVGPQTQMVLYDLLDRYPIPHLAPRGHSG